MTTMDELAKLDDEAFLRAVTPPGRQGVTSETA